jgi:putative ABC transport system substrate-binding protein
MAILWNAGDLGMSLRHQAVEAEARRLGLDVQSLGVRAPDDFEQAFALSTLDRSEEEMPRLPSLNSRAT